MVLQTLAIQMLIVTITPNNNNNSANSDGFHIQWRWKLIISAANDANNAASNDANNAASNNLLQSAQQIYKNWTKSFINADL